MTHVADGNWSAARRPGPALAIGDQVDDRDLLWNLANAALQLGDDAAQQHSTRTPCREPARPAP